MSPSLDDLKGIETATDLLVSGLTRGDISSITDLATDATMILAPSRRTASGAGAIEFWRKMAVATEGIRMLSQDMSIVADGLVRDTGTLSLRPGKSEERRQFRYMILWQGAGAEWKVHTMVWNLEASAGGRGGGGRPSAAGGGTGQM